MRYLRYLSVCSGIEAASVAWGPLGWTPVAFAEIDKFASAVLAHRYPAIPNLGDFTKIGAEHVGETVDLLVGGTPCFPAHVLIAARKGLVPISSIQIGDKVLTHKGRWRKVLSVGVKPGNTINLRGQGGALETTPEHPIYSRAKSREWVGREAGSYQSRMSSPDWLQADKMQGKFWASPVRWPRSVPPRIRTRGRETDFGKVTPDLLHVVGRWLGDGWCRINGRRGYVLICCGKGERAEMESILGAAGLKFSVSEKRTTWRFQIASRPFARWLVTHFKHGAANKTLPTWAFGLPTAARRALLDGYLGADGTETKMGWSATTISRSLSLSMVLLAQSLGYGVSCGFCLPKRKKNLTIEGRSVKEHGFFQLRIHRRSRSSQEIGIHRWGLVREIAQGREVSVFNLEVDGDNSYVADGIVVHNCQSFSIAGKRGGLDDARGNLALEFVALARRVRARWILWENVPGVLSSGGGRDFGAFLGALADGGYGFAYVVLDAQWFGVPQRRRRVFVVGHLGDWRRAAAVLLERQSLRRDPPPSRAAGKKVAGTLRGGAQSRGWADDTDRMTFVAHALCADGFDASEDGTGRGTPLVPCLRTVRRLTPRECERLQGFPDDWTLVPWRGGLAPAGPRYRAIGNSMAVPVMRWIGERIAAGDRLPPNDRRVERPPRDAAEHEPADDGDHERSD